MCFGRLETLEAHRLSNKNAWVPAFAGMSGAFYAPTRSIIAMAAAGARTFPSWITKA
jgi:hypothetical protein